MLDLRSQCLDYPEIEGDLCAVCAPDDWVITSESPDILDTSGDYPSSPQCELLGISGPSPGGGNVVFLVGVPPNTVESMATDISGLTPGVEYSFGMYWQGVTYACNTGFQIPPGELVINLDGQEYIFTGATEWTLVEFCFTPSSSTITLEVSANDNYNQAILVDSPSCSDLTPCCGLILDIDVTDTSCGLDNGEIEVIVSGGTSPYSYSIDGVNFQSANIFANLPAGAYTVTVQDANGCETTEIVNIANSSTPQIDDITEEDTTCGLDNGVLTITGSGGMAPLAYSIDGVNFQSSNIFDNLPVGSYTVTVQDASGCETTEMVEIANSGTPEIDDVTEEDTTCGLDNGSLTIAGSGGMAPLAYSIDGVNFQSSNIFDNLPAGPYTVTIQDANGCESTETADILDSDGVEIDNVSVTDAACGSDNGTTTTTASGGAAPLEYSIDGVNFQPSETFIDLASGNYTVTVQDANGCTATENFEIDTGDTPVFDAINPTDASCDLNNGALELIVSGGTSPYSYSIDGVNFQSANIFDNLPAGPYTVTVQDANGCETTEIVNIANSSTPQIDDITEEDTTCGLDNGVLTITGSGGMAPLAYSIDGVNFQSSNIFDNLPVGSYTVTVQDANGCETTEMVEIANSSTPQIDDVTEEDTTCGLDNGSLTIAGSGGMAPLAYSIDGVNFQSSNIFDNLPAGPYTVTIQDANGCESTETADILDSDGVEIDNVSVTDAACGSDNGTTTTTASGGAAPLEYSIDGVNFQPSETFIDLASGNYTVTVQDANGCTATENFEIDTGDTPVFDAINPTDASCDLNNGALELIVSGGTSPYSYSIDGVNFQSANIFDNLPAGAYTVTVQDANGCETTEIVNIANSSTPQIDDITEEDTTCGLDNGVLTITGSGGMAPLAYSIDGVNFQSSNIFDNLPVGSYTVTVQDASGCETTEMVEIANSGTPEIDDVTEEDTTCGLDNGSLTIAGSGGMAPLAYSIDGVNFQSSNIFDNLPAGPYTVTIQDANGCESTETADILDSDGVEIDNVSVTDAACGSDNGTTTTTASGGAAPLEYSIDGVNFQPSETFIDLASGNYTVTVQDANGCTATENFEIDTGDTPVFDAINPTDASCDLNNGALELIVSGGTSPYSYSLDGVNFQSSNIFDNLPAGAYTVTVQDTNGCETTEIVNIANSSTPQIDDITEEDTTCGLDNGVLTITGSGGMAPLAYSIDGVNFQSSNIFDNLSAGSYTITVQDANGCETTEMVEIANSDTPQIDDVTEEDTTCGLDNGSLTIAGSGGMAPLAYSIDGVNFQSSNIFDNLPAGPYTVTIQDANGCESTETADILDSDGVEIDLVSVTDVTCGLDNGTTTTTASGGAAPLEYSIDGVNFQPSETFIDLASGNYTVTVQDANGCTATENFEIDTGDTPVFDAINPTDASCDLNNGALELIVSGGTSPYSYSIDGVNFQSANIFANLPAGAYTVTVQDANGCETTEIVNIANSSTPQIDDITEEDTTCGLDNAVLTITGSGGMAPLAYSIDGVNFQSSNIFDNLPVGSYTVTVKDANGCEITEMVNIANSDTPQIDDVTEEDTTCGLDNGALTITGSGGMALLSYSIDGVNFQSSNIFDNLPAGPYTVTVQDANGCTDTETADILDSDGVEIDNVSVTDAACGSDNGTTTTTASGGAAPLEYSIDGVNFQPSETFIDLASGNYTVTVQDANGCTATENFEVLGGDVPVIDDINAIDASCDLDNGEVEISVSIGIPPYSYSIDSINFQVSNVFDNLSSGNYTVFVNDTNNCQVSTDITIETTDGPSIANIESVAASCDSTDGKIEITAMGTAVPLSYSLDGVNFQASNVFDNLPSGTYTVFVNDANNCQTSTDITIETTDGPSIANIESVDPSCDSTDGEIEITAMGTAVPLSYSLDGVNFQASNVFENLASGLYTVTVMDNNGCEDLAEVNLQSNTGPAITEVVIVNSNCSENTGTITITADSGVAPLMYSLDGINFQVSNLFENLSEGQYTLTVRDSQDCAFTQNVELQNTNSPQIEEILFQNTTCDLDNGAITVSVNNASADLLYALDNGSFQESEIFDDLPAGTYEVQVMNEFGCTISDDVTIDNSPRPVIEEIITTNVDCYGEGGTILISASSEVGNLLYSINEIDYQVSNLFENLESGTFTLSIVDGSSCEVIDEVAITSEDCDIYIPNIFSPNNDGNNDSFKIFPAENYSGKVRSLSIYDRWGEMVYNVMDAQATSGEWDGTFENKPVMQGVYVYVIEIEKKDGESSILAGDITLVR